MSDRLSVSNTNNSNLTGMPGSMPTEYQAKPVDRVERISRTSEMSKDKEGSGQQNSKEQTEKVIKGLNEFLSASNSHLKFQFHDGTKEYYVSIVDDKTNEVIKEIPSKKLLDMYAAMTDYLGLLVDRKA
ncbi:flagellar protein FlaG [Bacillus sp. DNRA2]|uniref:flagellar protein FlaG n=1 Tax=Bacillus sp. DNRA2 TaxID=2723053 RepID=UPI002006EBA3|nr:flagellar protein FlaG [Bacillus sp. DNRA2]